ncbi:MAG: hypothetical protein JSU63_09085, partial [Phycisphaerales bacterium]
NSTIAGELLALEILRTDDDDTNLLNSTPHFTQICKALGSISTSGDLFGHGIECPCNCGDEQPKFLDDNIHFYEENLDCKASLGVTYLV